MNPKKKANIPRRVILTLFSLPLILTIATLINQFHSPGDVARFKYIGKTETGCYLACPMPPTWVYYYATDLDESGLIEYLKPRAHYLETSQDDLEFDVYSRNIYFKDVRGKIFSLTSYKTNQQVRSENGLEDRSELPYTYAIPERAREEGNFSTFQSVVGGLKK